VQILEKFVRERLCSCRVSCTVLSDEYIPVSLVERAHPLRRGDESQPDATVEIAEEHIRGPFPTEESATWLDQVTVRNQPLSRGDGVL
jgi:hypothetical protein